MAVCDSRPLYAMLRTNKSKAPRAEENENLHKEYIYNLQQQIHYLELENKYLCVNLDTLVLSPFNQHLLKSLKNCTSFNTS